MKVEVKVKGSSRKKLMHMSWSCEKMGDEKRTESTYPESRGEMEAGKKTEIAMGNCITSDLG